MTIVLTLSDVQFDPETHRLVPTVEQCADLRELFAQMHDQKAVIDFVAPFYGATPEQREKAEKLAEAEREAAIAGNDKLVLLPEQYVEMGVTEEEFAAMSETEQEALMKDKGITFNLSAVPEDTEAA